jgi:hypothetical protein
MQKCGNRAFGGSRSYKANYLGFARLLASSTVAINDRAPPGTNLGLLLSTAKKEATIPWPAPEDAGEPRGTPLLYSPFYDTPGVFHQQKCAGRRSLADRSTRPPGYQSNHHAVMDLVKFGPELWGVSTFAVLLFHAERSTSYGKEADAHSQSQAVEGIYSRRTGEWLRGNAGVSAATWKRANLELESAGIITKELRQATNTGNAPTEWRINWLAVRGAIQECKERPAPFTARAAAPLAHGEPPPLAHGEPPPLAHSEPDKVSDLLQLGLNTVSECAADEIENKPASTVHQIRDALTHSHGFELRKGDPLPGKLCAIAHKLHLPITALELWVSEKIAEKKRKNYHIQSAGALLEFAQVDLLPWAQQHGELIHRIHREEELQKQRSQAKKTELTVMEIKTLPAETTPAERIASIEERLNDPELSDQQRFMWRSVLQAEKTKAAEQQQPANTSNKKARVKK